MIKIKLKKICGKFIRENSLNVNSHALSKYYKHNMLISVFTLGQKWLEISLLWVKKD